MVSDPRFATNQKRVENGIELDEVIAGYIRARDLATNLAHFDQAGVTIGPIMEAEHLDGDPYLVKHESLIEVPDDEMPGGWLPMHGAVPRLSGTPGILARPAPRLGEHNAEVLAPLLGQAELERLRAAKVVLDNAAG
jgi:formyl-CoA transferase